MVAYALHIAEELTFCAPQNEFFITEHAARRTGERDRLSGWLTPQEIARILREAISHGKKVAHGVDDDRVRVHKILLRRVDTRRGFQPFYAVVVEDEPGDYAVLTVLTELQYKRSVRKGEFSTCDMFDLI